MATLKPTRVRVRMYDAGFGDCFLLSFDYATPVAEGRKTRHVLIDYGSTKRRGTGPELATLAPQIKKHCGGHLDALIVTHRHKDHLSGFADKDAIAIFKELKPQLVIRPWTEDPKLKSNATGPSISKSGHALVKTLEAAEATSAAIASAIDTDKGLRGHLRAYAALNIANAAAIKTLNDLAGDKGEFLHAGMTTRLQRLLPGVKIQVLGPPTVDQWPDVTGRASRDPEYWMLHKSLWVRGAGALGKSLRHQLAGEGEEVEPPLTPAGPIRWLVERLSSQQLYAARRVVRALDEALNNTSLILLFEAGTQRLLFPGDAQIENWSYTLKEMERRPSLRDDLQQVNFYKVGHHGSRNATPKTLYKLWTEPGIDHEMIALVSTMANVHGETTQTAVPRATLVNALKRRMPLLSTQTLKKDEDSLEVSASCRSNEPFVRSD